MSGPVYHHCIVQSLQDLLRRDAPRFGPRLAEAAFARGLAVTQPDGTRRPIPVTATPIVLPAAELRRRVESSRLISSATLKVARCVLRGNDRERILGALSPLERSLAEQTWESVQHLATTRVDYFVKGEVAWALEVNATIPAMQGYSDIAAHAFIEQVGRHAGLDDGWIARLQAENGSNALALFRALLEGYGAQREGRLPERILLLCRRNDAQLTEQQYLAQRFGELGVEAEVAHPDELSGDGVVEARGKKWDLVYRHLFVRRLEQTPCPFVERFFADYRRWKTVLLNPPSAQVEVKAAFALLSRAASEPELAAAAGLSPEELEATVHGVPWTRQLEPDRVAEVAAEPDRFVLKRSWDYGGKAVFVGRARGTPQFEERTVAAFGEWLDWPELCRRASQDPVGGGFVVQHFVDTEPEPHLLCTTRDVVPADLYVDFSAYASVHPGRQPAWGGVCRGSLSQIVNIVGGGGVLPLLTAEVAAKLERAFQAQLPPR
jgi:hypothetical protein